MKHENDDESSTYCERVGVAGHDRNARFQSIFKMLVLGCVLYWGIEGENEKRKWQNYGF